MGVINKILEKMLNIVPIEIYDIKNWLATNSTKHYSTGHDPHGDIKIGHNTTTQRATTESFSALPLHPLLKWKKKAVVIKKSPLYS